MCVSRGVWLGWPQSGNVLTDRERGRSRHWRELKGPEGLALEERWRC